MTRLEISARQASFFCIRIILSQMSGHHCLSVRQSDIACFTGHFADCFTQFFLQIGEKHATDFPNRNQEFRSGHSHRWMLSGGLKHAQLV